MLIVGGTAYEATMLHGCRAVPVEVAMKGVVGYQDMLVPVSDLGKAVEFGKNQIGKPYDFAGAFGLPLLMSDDWSDWSKWWCSELTFMQLGAAGNFVLDPAEKTRITPNDLHQCNFEKTPFVRIK